MRRNYALKTLSSTCGSETYESEFDTFFNEESSPVSKACTGVIPINDKSNAPLTRAELVTLHIFFISNNFLSLVLYL